MAVNSCPPDGFETVFLPIGSGKELDTMRSKLEIVEKRLNEIINGRYSDIESPKAIARQCKKEIGLE